MVFNYKNNVIVDLASAVAAGVTTINVDPVKQDLLPDGIQSTLATLEEIDANGVITKRECIRITNRSGGALTVVRADQECPASDSATTHTQTSFPFDPSNGARIGMYLTAKAMEEIEAAIASLQGDFVTEVAYINNTDRYSVSTTGTDAYELLIDTLDASSTPIYQGLVDGQKFDVDLDVANTGGATLTINNSVATFGPKPLTKFNGQPLASGDLTAGLKTVVMYDANDDHWRVVGTLGNYSNSLTVDNIKKDFELGEDFPLSGDNEGAGFLGVSETIISNANNPVTVTWGAAAANEKIRFCFDKYATTYTIDSLGGPVGSPSPGTDIGRTLGGSRRSKRAELVNNFGGAEFFDSFTARLTRTTVGTTDGLICTVYDGINGTVVAQSTNIIAGTSLTVGVYTDEVFNFGVVHIEDSVTELFFEISRTGALDNTDFYRWLDTTTSETDSDSWEFSNIGWLPGGVGSQQFSINFIDTNIFSKNLREYSVFLQKQGAPLDDINVTFWEDNAQIISDLSGDITNAEVTGVDISKILQRTWASGEGRHIYIEFDRVGAVDIVNNYQIKSDVTISNGFTYQLWDGATWISGGGSPVGSGTFGFTPDKMWLSDNRSEEGDTSDGVVLSSGVATDIRSFVTAGYNIQTVGTIGGAYYIDSTDGGIKLGHFVQNVSSVDEVVRGALIGQQKTTGEMELYIPESNFHRIGTPAIRVPGLSNVEYRDITAFVPATSATLILSYQHTMIRNGGYTIQVFRDFLGETVWLDFDATNLNVGDVIQVYTRETGGNIFGELRVNGLSVDTVTTAATTVRNFTISYDEVFTYTTTA